MALAFTVDGQVITRSSGLIAASSDYSCILTFRPDTAPTGGAKRTVWAMRNAGYTAYVRIVSDANANTFRLQADAGGGQSQTTTVTFEADIRGSIAYTRSGTTHTFYCNGDSIGSFTLDVSAVTFANAVIGDDGASVAGLEVQYFREWNSALTLAQIFAEWNSPTAIVATDTDTPLVSDLLDDSGNGHDWTATGAPAFVAGPTPVPRTNVSALTAYAVPSLPASIYQVAKDSTGSTADLWYTYTAAGESLFNAFAVGAITGAYDFVTEMYEGPAAAPTLLVGSTNRAIQYPATTGTVYLWLLDKPAVPANAAGAAWFSLVAQTNASAPAGSIVVPADFADVPETRIDPATGAVLRFGTPKGIGEQGDVLPSGIFLMDNNDVGDQLELYSSTGALITTLPFAFEGVVDPAIRACNAGNKFYVANGGPGAGNSQVVTVLPEGTFGPTSWAVGQDLVGALAANNAETILYYATTDPASPVYRWDLSTNTTLSDFVAGQAGYRVKDILVLDDDTVVVGWFETSADFSYIVRRYNAAGVLQNTYDFGDMGQGTVVTDAPRLAYATDDPDSFWVWLHVTTASLTEAHFQNITTATGVATVDLVLPEYHQNISLDAEATEPPTPRPGVPSSCPFFIARASAGGIVVTKTVIPATDTTEFTITAGGGLSPASFTLANGASQVLPAAAGSGYSITETVDTAVYATSYQVSNGSPIDNITVADGETVTVTITNQTASRVPIRRYRRTPTLYDENQRLYIPYIEVDAQVGVGNTTGLTSDTTPVLMVRASRDGGWTWTNERTVSLGEIGTYGTRVKLNRWGQGRKWVFEFNSSAAVSTILSECYLTVQKGAN
jgi:hypothetical protein